MYTQLSYLPMPWKGKISSVFRVFSMLLESLPSNSISLFYPFLHPYYYRHEMRKGAKVSQCQYSRIQMVRYQQLPATGLC